jgi:hypothetical protein
MVDSGKSEIAAVAKKTGPLHNFERLRIETGVKSAFE